MVLNLQFSNEQQIYQEQVTTVNNNEVKFAQSTGHDEYFSAQGDAGVSSLVQGQGGNFTSSFEEMVSSSNYPDGLEFLYGEGMIDHKIIDSTITTVTTCGQSSTTTTNWGEPSTSIYHHNSLVPSNYQGQGVRQECALQEFSYPRGQ